MTNSTQLIDARPSRKIKTSRRLSFDVHCVDSHQRTAVENYIIDKYFQTHHATISEFLPLILNISSDEIIAATIGIRPGINRPLFLEQYLEAPIEQLIAQIAKQPIDRCKLVELGNLAISNRSIGPLLFFITVMAIANAGFEWMVFTVTQQVEKLILRSGYKPYHLADADPASLQGDQQCWGNYYNNHPKVMAARVDDVVALIHNELQLASTARFYRQQIHEIANTIQHHCTTQVVR